MPATLAKDAYTMRRQESNLREDTTITNMANLEGTKPEKPITNVNIFKEDPASRKKPEQPEHLYREPMDPPDDKPNTSDEEDND